MKERFPDLPRARELFPEARRAVLYKWTDAHLEADLRSIARNCGPCDLACTAIEAEAEDRQIRRIFEICQKINAEMEETC